ncbi:MAG: leucine-rich repeat domain-containing protein [Promethearchaeota archaeon]
MPNKCTNCEQKIYGKYTECPYCDVSLKPSGSRVDSLVRGLDGTRNYFEMYLLDSEAVLNTALDIDYYEGEGYSFFPEGFWDKFSGGDDGGDGDGGDGDGDDGLFEIDRFARYKSNERTIRIKDIGTFDYILEQIEAGFGKSDWDIIQELITSRFSCPGCHRVAMLDMNATLVAERLFISFPSPLKERLLTLKPGGMICLKEVELRNFLYYFKLGIKTLRSSVLNGTMPTEIPDFLSFILDELEQGVRVGFSGGAILYLKRGIEIGGKLLELNSLDMGDTLNLSLNDLTNRRDIKPITSLSDIKGLEYLEGIKNMFLSGHELESIEIPRCLSTLLHLSLNGNRIKEIKGLGVLTKLETLELNRNELETIPDLSGLDRLKKLDLGGNRLTSTRGLSNLPLLKEVKLNRNHISSIDGMGDLPCLQSLELKDNLIVNMDGLGKLVSLTSLDLSRNRIRKIEGLDTLVKLQSLKLGRNAIKKIENLEACVNLGILYLDNNRIGRIGGLDSLKRLWLLNLQGNRIREIEGLQELDRLNELRIGGNLINNRVVGSLGGYDNRELDRFNNANARSRLHKEALFPGIDGVRAQEASWENFNYMFNLRDSKVSDVKAFINYCKSGAGHDCRDEGNAEPSDLDDEGEDYDFDGTFVVFHGRKYSVKDGGLMLIKKNIRSFDEIKGLDKVESLVNIVIIGGSLESLDALYRFSGLKTLAVNENVLDEIPDLTKFPHLEDLSLKSNRIFSMAAVSKAPLLEKIDLQKNFISKIEGLEALPNLKTIDLHQNRITRVEGFGSLNEIKEIGLIGNLIDPRVLADLGGFDPVGRVREPLFFVRKCKEDLNENSSPLAGIEILVRPTGYREDNRTPEQVQEGIRMKYRVVRDSCVPDLDVDRYKTELFNWEARQFYGLRYSGTGARKFFLLICFFNEMHIKHITSAADPDGYYYFHIQGNEHFDEPGGIVGRFNVKDETFMTSGIELYPALTWPEFEEEFSQLKQGADHVFESLSGWLVGKESIRTMDVRGVLDGKMGSV